jgi:hypothetical protein
VLTVRPKVAQLKFQLYGRSLHPELFDTFQSRTIQRGGYEAKIDITSAGHVVTWRYGGVTLTEVAAAANHPLPEGRRIMDCRLQGKRRDLHKTLGGILYEFSFELETIKPELFWTFQRELAHDGKRQGMLQVFQSSGRMALGALSYIHVESRNQTLITQALHTFPDDSAIVKIESQITIP